MLQVVMNPGVQETITGYSSRSQSMPLLSVWGQQQAHRQITTPMQQQQHQQPQIQNQPHFMQQQYQQHQNHPTPGFYQFPQQDLSQPKRERSGAAVSAVPRSHRSGPQSPRDNDDNDNNDDDDDGAPAQQKAGKRSRGNAYRAPREVKPTVTSVMGSLVGGAFQQSNGTVRMRRQLSGSQLDQFMTHGDPDKMDEDTVPTRERAMSF